jgi:hypothetical protein
LNIRNLATERDVSHPNYRFPDGSLSHHEGINGLSPALLRPSARATITGASPFRRFAASPLLASDDAAFMTGAGLVVDAG